MPRPARSRLVYCDCLDCSDDCAAPLVQTDESLQAAERVAQQRPPPKGIVLFGSGLIHSWQGSSSLDECAVPHMDTLVKEGQLCVIAFRQQQSTDSRSAGLHELEQLCEVYEELHAQPAGQEGSQGRGSAEFKLTSFAERHQGMQVVGTTNCPVSRKLLDALGTALPPALQLETRARATGSEQQQASSGLEDGTWPGRHLGLPSPGPYAGQLLHELGVAEGSSGPDVLLVHLDVLAMDATQMLAQGQALDTGQNVSATSDSDASPPVSEDASLHEAACEGLLWLDLLLSALMRRQEVREQVLLTVMLTPQGQAGAADAPTDATGNRLGLPVQRNGPLLSAGQLLDPGVHVVTPRDMSAIMGGAGAMRGLDLLDSDQFGSAHVPMVPRPIQSWQLRGLKQVDVNVQAPGLCARRLPGVVRRDRAERMSLEEAAGRGGAGGMLVDRLLPEIAYKLGKAPKYGA